MANKVAVVTDSTAYLPQEIIDKYGMKVTPLVVIWAGEEYRDNVDISADEFFSRLTTAKEMPTTSQPTPAVFKEVYEELLGQGYDILSIHISGHLSGTIASAKQAKAMFEEGNIEIVDSLSTSMGLGWTALLSARLAQEGKNLAEVKDFAEKACQNTYVAFAVDTLEFLHRGGRIGGAQHLLGSALNMKPILHLDEGKIDSLEKVRTRKKSLNRLAEVAIEAVGGKTPVYLAVFHAEAEEDAQYVLDKIAAAVNPKETMVTGISPVIGVHTGPKVVGFSFLAGLDI